MSAGDQGVPGDGEPAGGDEAQWWLRARRLTKTEIATYDLVPEHLVRSVVVVEIPQLPGPIAGITLGRFVFHQGELDRTRPSPLLAHELVHVRQYADQGVLRFGLAYNAAFLRNLARDRRWWSAYRGIPAEVEAREEADNWWERVAPRPGRR